MSLNNFLSYLQQLLTMVDPKNRHSISLAKTALSATIAMAVDSDKVDPRTYRVMVAAEENFSHLVDNARDFAGKPGDIAGNENRRHRLQMTLYPSC